MFFFSLLALVNLPAVDRRHEFILQEGLRLLLEGTKTQEHLALLEC